MLIRKVINKSYRDSISNCSIAVGTYSIIWHATFAKQMATRYQNNWVFGNFNALEALEVSFSRLDTSIELLPQISNCLFLELCYLDLTLYLVVTSKLLINSVHLSFPEVKFPLELIRLLVCLNYLFFLHVYHLV